MEFQKGNLLNNTFPRVHYSLLDSVEEQHPRPAGLKRSLQPLNIDKQTRQLQAQLNTVCPHTKLNLTYFEILDQTKGSLAATSLTGRKEHCSNIDCET